MKKIAALLLALTMAVSLAACAREEPPDVQAPDTQAPATEATEAPTYAAEAVLPTGEPVELTWSSWAMTDPAVLALYQQIADAYNESNPYNITVLITPPTEDYLTELLFATASGVGPDVAHIPAQWLPQLLQLGVVRCLNSYVSQAMLEDLFPGTREAVTVNSELMAMPWYAEARALLVNGELCRQAEVDPQTIASWEDLMAAAEKIAALEPEVYGLGIPGSGKEMGEGYNTLPVIWAHGGEFLAEGEVRLESDAAGQAYAELQKLFLEGITPREASLQDLRDLFTAGKLGFYWDTETGGAALSGSAQAMAIPGCGYLDTQVLAVFDSCGDEKMAAAVHFMEYLSGPEAIGLLRQEGHAVMSSRDSVQTEMFATCGSVTAAYVQAMSTARALPVGHLRFQEVDGMLSEMLRELAQGGDVAQILIKWDGQIQEVYDD